MNKYKSRLVNKLTSIFLCDIACEENIEDVSTLKLRAAGIVAPNGFTVQLRESYRSVEASFSPDTFAAPLIKAICSADKKMRDTFVELVNVFISTGTQIIIKIDGQPRAHDSLPAADWNSFELICYRLSEGDKSQRYQEDVIIACFSLIFSLLPMVREVIHKDLNVLGMLEGRESEILVTRYERSPINRAAAIAIHGFKCFACSFEFESFYGEYGNGFIEVHHRVPVSQMGGSYTLNPFTDLVPLCSNCHSMVHRMNPPMSPEELRDMLINRGGHE